MRNLSILALILVMGIWLGSCANEKPESPSPAAPQLAQPLPLRDNPAPPGPIPPATVVLAVPEVVDMPPPIDVPSLTPSEITATLRPGQCLTEHKILHLPAEVTPPLGDIVISMDLTGSTTDEHANVTVNAINIMNAVRAVVPDSRFGVVSHMDYPAAYSSCGYDAEYGYADPPCDDYPYRLDQPLTSDIPTAAAALGGLVMACGADGPESYARVFLGSYMDLGIGYRPGAKKIVLAFLDNIPHDSAVDAILGRSMTTGADPGRNGIIGDGDDIPILIALSGMGVNEIMPIIVYSGDPAGFPLWEAFCGVAGGQAFQINPDGTIPGGMDIAEFVASLIRGSIRHFDEVTLATCLPDYAGWLTSVVPPRYTDVTLGEPIDLPFDIEICVPAGTPTGRYCFDVCGIGDGVFLAAQHVCITVVVGIEVPFDIKPTSCPNPLNTGSNGVIPAAFCGMAGFDVTMIDPASVRLAGVAPIRWALEDVCAPYLPPRGKDDCLDCNTLGPDGFRDLTLKFDT